MFTLVVMHFKKRVVRISKQLLLGTRPTLILFVVVKIKSEKKKSCFVGSKRQDAQEVEEIHDRYPVVCQIRKY